MADDNFKEIIDRYNEYKASGKPEVTVEEAFREGIDSKLANLNATEEQKDWIKLSIIMQMQLFIDIELQQTIPDGLFEYMDELLDKEEIDQEEIVGLTILSYEYQTGESIFEFIKELLDIVLPKNLTIFNKMQGYVKSFAGLSEEGQRQLVDLVKSKNIEEAQKLLGVR